MHWLYQRYRNRLNLKFWSIFGLSSFLSPIWAGSGYYPVNNHVYCRVLVGAPEADTIQGRWGVKKPGAVFRCETDLPHRWALLSHDLMTYSWCFRCEMIPFDMTGNNNDTGGPIDEKSNQWFGASLSSSGEDGVIVVSYIRTFCWSSFWESTRHLQ